MRSVLDYEMDYIFKLYSKKVTLLGFDKMAKSGYKKLQNEFALKYNDLFKQIKGSNEKLGKSKEEVSYAILKIRRLIALWEKEGIIKVEGGVKYSANDKHQEFPIFGSQHFEIAPTKQTICKATKNIKSKESLNEPISTKSKSRYLPTKQMTMHVMANMIKFFVFFNSSKNFILVLFLLQFLFFILFNRLYAWCSR